MLKKLDSIKKNLVNMIMNEIYKISKEQLLQMMKFRLNKDFIVPIRICVSSINIIKNFFDYQVYLYRKNIPL